MRAIVIAVLGVVLAACSPSSQPSQAAQTPEAVVRAVYDAAAQRNAHDQATNVDDVPLSDSLRALVRQAASAAEANDEPFIDGDIVLDCQDCSPLSAVTVTTTSSPANGHATVEARFTVAGSARVETWEMVETAQGWRADNMSCADTRGAEEAARLVAQCTQVSPATHPPCNAANSCAMIEGEIHRGCDLLDAAHKPAFCIEATDEAP
jgi:hypothetical protein